MSVASTLDNAPLPRVVKAPILRVENLCVDYPVGRAGFWGGQRLVAHAVSDVSFQIQSGETFGLVGESGSGKTTTGRAILGRAPVTSGRVVFDGEDITHLSREAWRQLRRRIQLVFQDPYASLNPRMSVGDIVAEPLLVHGIMKGHDRVQKRVKELLELVGLPPDATDRFPHAFSGGQRQRIGIARALALEPELIIADEPVSALDVSVQAQVVNLLQDLQRQIGISYLFIAHDLSVVRHISHQVGVMYAGKLVEVADYSTIYHAPKHPYTKALLTAVPVSDPPVQRERQAKRTALPGEIPNPVSPPSGCRFHTRCPIAQARCHDDSPVLVSHGGDHQVSCWYA
jgi:oligopeptide/dipeptide ABC transporter ATP-binding protein